MRIQRLAVFIAVVIVVVVVLAIGVSRCRQHAKESSYRTYFTDVQAMIDDSTDVGRGLGKLLSDPPLDKRELTQKLDELVAKQNEVTKRAQNAEVPDQLKDLHDIFVLGMKVRLRGVEQARDGLLAATGKNTKATAAKLAALQGYFSGPDVYYTEQYKTQAQQVMADDGVTNVAVPTSDLFMRKDLFDAAAIEAALQRVKSAGAEKGVHGVGIASVTAKPADVKLVEGKDTKVPSSTDLVFAVTVENQGSVTESKVVVKVTFTPAGSEPQVFEGTIDAIGPGEKRTIELGPIVPTESSLAKTSELKVQAGPVKGEKVTSNNSATFGVILEFK
jgi:hypothetical protein